MKKPFISFHPSLALALVCFGSACAHRPEPPSADARFDDLARTFLQTHFAFRPLDGVALGWHQFDGQFVVPTGAALAQEVHRLAAYDTDFAKLPAAQLSPPRRQDLAVLRSAIAGQRFVFETQRAPVRNPMFYAGALDVSVYIKRSFKPLPDRVRDVVAILRQAPALFTAARANLEPGLPKPFVETAIEVAEGTASFLQKDVTAYVASLPDAALIAEYQAASQMAVTELRQYVAWLRDTRLPRAKGDFALGRANYQTMLAAELVDLTPEQILETGLQELHDEQRRFAAAAGAIDPSHSPVDVYRAIQKEHPSATELIPRTRLDLDAIRQFVIDHHLVTVPSQVRPRVEETLPPFRATSFASMDTPGPFERVATEAYYYVTPVEPIWTPAQAEEWLTAFNFYTMDVVSIHEVYPGHYVQFLALNASGASDVEKAFYSYPFVEGWAHYTEQMMLEERFGQPPASSAPSAEELRTAAKYRLAQSGEALLRLCRLCCSIRLHTQRMTVDEATQFFIDNCYYEAKPSQQEALRGTFDPGYLYYSLGKLMILKLRQDWQAQEGAAFTLERFHDEFLRHGAPPIPLLRELMLKDPARRPRIL